MNFSVYQIQELSQILSGRPVNVESHAQIRSFSIDSRTLMEGDWFFCISGERTDGHDHVEQALARGAAGVVLNPSRLPKHLQNRNFPRIQVPDPNSALREWAAHARQYYRGKVLGITGSNGKTSTKEMLARLCAGIGQQVEATPGNFNNWIGVPLTLLSADPDTGWWVIEMGTNRFGEMAELSRIVMPDGAILTNIGESHLEFLRDTEGVAREKCGMFEGMNSVAPVIVPSSLLHLDQVEWFANECGVRLVRYALDEEGDELAADYHAQTIESSGSGILFSLFGLTMHAGTANPLQLRNLISALVLLHQFGISAELLQHAAEILDLSVPGRFHWRKLKQGWLIDDTYNANPGSFLGVLQAIRSMHPEEPLWVVAGPMAELGERSPELHRETGATIFNAGAERLFILGGETGAEYLRGWSASGGGKTKAQRFSELPELLDVFNSQWPGRGIVLVKGSRSARMERFVEKVFESVSETT